MTPAQEAALETPVLSSRFELRRKLGEGAFGTVYEAVDRQNGCTVALKQLRRTNAENLSLFKQEFRSLVDIAHPNLVALYELLASDEGDWLLLMEFIDGVDFLSFVSSTTPPPETSQASARASLPISGTDPTLDGLIPQDLVATIVSKDRSGSIPRTGSLPSFHDRVFIQSGAPLSHDYGVLRSTPVVDFARLQQAMLQLATGLMALHSAGKLHRDLKPSNIMVAADGRVVLLDFGLVTDASESHQEGMLVGTPAYMAPEQIAVGKSGSAGDWYSVGVVLYEALTGRLPFDGDFADLAANKISRDPVPPSSLRSAVPAELDSLCMQLLRRDPTARPSGEQVLSWLGGTSARPARAAASVELIGREAQYGVLQDALRRLTERRPSVIMVEGLSGMGKTTLTKSFLRTEKTRHPQLLILEGRCYEQESVPYKAFDAIMESLVHKFRDRPFSAPPDLLDEDSVALTQLFPALHKLPGLDRQDEGVTGKIADARELRDRAFAALRRLLSWIGSQWPLVLFIDDLQWADEDSGALLIHLMEPPTPPQLLLVLTLRADEVETSPLLRWLHPKLIGLHSAELQVHRACLGPLSEEQVGQLASSLIAHPKTNERLLQMLREGHVGSPFLVTEAARFLSEAENSSTAMDSALVGDVDALMQHRLSRLSAASIRALQVLAAAGRPVLRSIVRQVATLGTDELSALHQLRVGHFVRTRQSDAGELIEPYHDSIRQSVSAQLSKTHSIHIHHQLALCLDREGSTDYEALAMHCKSGELKDRAAHYLRLAARQAARSLAFERAAALYREALLDTQAEDFSALSGELGHVLSATGHGRAAADAFLAAAARASEKDKLQLQSQAGAQLLRSGFLDEGIEVLQLVLSQLKIRLPESPRTSAILGFLRRQYTELRGLSCTIHDEKECSPADLQKLDVLHSVTIAYSMSHVMRASDVLGRLTAATLQVGEPFRLAQTLLLCAAFWATRGARKHAVNQRYVDRAIEVGGKLGKPLFFAYLSLCTGVMAYLEGRFAVARDDLREAERRLRAFPGVAWELEVAMRYSLSAQMFLGEYRELAQRSDKILRDAVGRDDAYTESTMRPTVLYFAELLRDDAKAAWAHIEAARARWKNKGFHGQHYWIECAKLEVLLYEGRFSEIAAHMAGEWVHLTMTQMTPYHEFARIAMLHRLGRAGLVAAVVAKKHRKTALREVERACDKLRKEGAPWAHALSLHLHAGRLAMTEGNRPQTRRAMEDALTLLRDTGLRIHVASLRDCAYRLGMTDLISADEHEQLLAEMRESGVSVPARLLRMNLPIFPPGN